MVGNCGGEGVGVVCMAVGQKGCGELYGVVVIGEKVSICVGGCGGEEGGWL